MGPLVEDVLGQISPDSLSVPREKAEVGDLYVYDGQRASAPCKISFSFNETIEMPEVLMGNTNAEAKFFDAVNSFRFAEQAARANMNQIDQRAFKMVVIDLDAALPGLDDVTRGRALLLKAASLHWLYVSQLSAYDSVFAMLNDIEGQAQLKSLREEALSWALQGRAVVVESGTPSDLAWADDLASKLQS